MEVTSQLTENPHFLHSFKFNQTGLNVNPLFVQQLGFFKIMSLENLSLLVGLFNEYILKIYFLQHEIINTVQCM